jgi:uncharacterized protein YkwD
VKPRKNHKHFYYAGQLFACICIVVALGCGSSSKGNSDGLGPYNGTPWEGLWVGENISFEIVDGQMVNWFITGIQCSWVSENPDKPEQCARAPEIDSNTAVTIENGAILTTLGNLVVQGTFTNAGNIQGSWNFTPYDCCSSMANWTAHHISLDKIPPEDTTDDSEDATDDVGTPTTDTSVAPPPDTADPPQDGYLVPGNLTAEQVKAINRTNWYRQLAGLPLVDMIGALNTSCQAHADYYILHFEEYKSGKIQGGSHKESSDYPEGFTGTTFSDRCKAAGYKGSPGFEVIAFLGDGTKSVDSWMETVYHRIPFMSPDMIHAGYGGNGGGPSIDVMNFGRASGDKSLIILYPVPGQIDVPRSWNGLEGPQPPPPPNGYPSGSVISIHTARGAPLSISTHELIGPVTRPSNMYGFRRISMISCPQHGPCMRTTRSKAIPPTP